MDWRLSVTNRTISKLPATSNSAISLVDEFPTRICTDMHDLRRMAADKCPG